MSEQNNPHFTDPQHVADLESKIAALEAEVAEQCRLNGMGSEREARLMAQLAEAKAKEDETQPWADDVSLNGEGAPPDTGHIVWLIQYLRTVHKRFGNTAVVYERLRWGASALWAKSDFEKKVAALEAQLAEAKQQVSELEKRRGGECDTCGGWVCPPLRCVGCMMKQRITPDADPSVLLADSLKKQDSDLAELRSQLAAAVRRAEEAERKSASFTAIVRFGHEAWEDGERVVTIDGQPIGCSVSRHCANEIVRWAGSAWAELIRHNNERSEAAAAIERARGGTDGE